MVEHSGRLKAGSVSVSLSAVLQKAAAATLQARLESDYAALEPILRGRRIPRKQILDYAISEDLVDQFGNTPSSQTIFRTLKRIEKRRAALPNTGSFVVRVPASDDDRSSEPHATQPSPQHQSSRPQKSRLRELEADAKERAHGDSLFGQHAKRLAALNARLVSNASVAFESAVETPVLDRRPVSDGKPPTRNDE